MRRSVFLSVCFTALTAIVTTVSMAEAAQPPGPVSWNAGSPAAAKGSITASGTWTAQPGWAPMGNEVLYAAPTGGGTLLNAAGAITANPNKWGPTTINNVPTGQYTVYSMITFVDANMNQVTVSSPTSIVNVP
jgi:hypothetical protein